MIFICTGSCYTTLRDGSLSDYPIPQIHHIEADNDEDAEAIINIFYEKNGLIPNTDPFINKIEVANTDDISKEEIEEFKNRQFECFYRVKGEEGVIIIFEKTEQTAKKLAIEKLSKMYEIRINNSHIKDVVKVPFKMS